MYVQTKDSKMNPEEMVNSVTDIALVYGPKLIAAVVVWIVGSWIIKLLLSGLNKVMTKSNVDASLRPFLNSLMNSSP